MDIEKISGIFIAFAGGIAAVIGAIFALRQLRQLLKPIRVEPSFTLH